MKRVKPRKPIGPEETGVFTAAQKLSAGGSAAEGFKSGVYGDPEQRFSLAGDVKAMQDVAKEAGMLNDQEAEAMATQMMGNEPSKQAAGFVEPTQEAPQAPQTPTHPQVPISEEQPLTLSEDPQKRLSQISEALGKIGKNAPSPQLLTKWKQIHGDIFILNIEERAFVYRYLKRQEWVQLKATGQQQSLTEDQFNDLLFDRCVLWPSLTVEQRAMHPAGTTDMLVEQIKAQSYFLAPEVVAQFTFKV